MRAAELPRHLADQQRRFKVRRSRSNTKYCFAFECRLFTRGQKNSSVSQKTAYRVTLRRVTNPRLIWARTNPCRNSQSSPCSSGNSFGGPSGAHRISRKESGRGGKWASASRMSCGQIFRESSRCLRAKFTGSPARETQPGRRKLPLFL